MSVNDDYEDICMKKTTEHHHTTFYDDFEEQYITNEVDDYYPLYEEYYDGREKDAYIAPLFDGRAHMTARTRLPAKSFDIWAEVSAVCGGGALMSASGVRDYLWVGFVEDKAVLRWDAGNGPLELRSGKVRMDGRSKLSARRYKKDALLKLGTAAARGSTHGPMSSLNIDPYVFIGRAPDNVTLLSGMKIPGFVGCVHRLRISGRDIIPPTRGMPVTTHGVRPCTPHNLAQLVCP
ncbi:Basement membrane-specific heparan sulfate proteoglycan core protein [Papilio xuthus]|nr:Basement membrane-specific heparan sulfate proteoglycan core protein [Papilio xuthus]